MNTMITNTLKKRTIDTLSVLVYQNSKLMLEALEYCKKNKNISMVQYVEKHFSSILNMYTEVKEQYIKELKQQNKKNNRKGS